MERISHWIGGKVVPGESGRTGPVYDPATGEQTHEVDFATTEEVGQAVAAAAEAFPAWRATSLSKRSDVMFQIRELLEDRKATVAAAITAQHGKVLSDAMGEVQRGLENVEFACGIPNLLKGGFTEQASTGVDVYSIRQPLGVVAGITPFNFPAMVPLWMLTNAIACGNTFVLKPSEKDPGASLVLAELLRDAGVPDGVFNVVHGDKVAVDADPGSTRHPGGVVRRLDPDREVHLRARHEGRQARPGARRREEPHDRAARRRPRHGGRRRRLRRLRQRRRALHGDLRDRRRRRDRRRPRREDRRPPAEGEGRAGDRSRSRDGTARHARAPRQGGGLPRLERRARGHGRPRRAGGRGLRRRRVLPRRVADRPRHRGDGRLQGRDLRSRSSRSSAWTPTTRR